MKTLKRYRIPRSFLTVLAATVFAGHVAAQEPRVFTVDNTGGPHADFTDLQEAMDAAEDGDVFHVLGSPISYGTGNDTLTITRQVHLFGPGYNIARVHEEGYQNFHEAVLGDVEFVAVEDKSESPPLIASSSAGSSMSGFRAENISVGTEDVTVRNNYVDRIFVSKIFHENSALFGVLSVGDRVTLLQNFVDISMNTSNADIGGHVVAGNIVMGSGSFGDSTVRNNVLMKSSSDYSFTNSVVENNIIRRVDNSRSDSFYNHNVFIENEPASADDFLSQNSFSNNLWGADETLLFKRTGAFDEEWQLGQSSPARGAGAEGVDAGAFDGAFPYKLSGVPSLPRVKIMAPGPFMVSPNSDLTIPVKIKLD